MPTFSTSLVLSGGGALGSYQAGLYEALHDHADIAVGWVAGSSVGAINGAIIAGSSPVRRVQALREYWLRGSLWQGEPLLRTGSVRHAFNWLSAAQARLLGSPRHLRLGSPSGLYDLAPTVDFLRENIDFGLLNGGETRFTVATVDLETGDPVIFDTGKGQRIELDHILASAGFIPEFAPVEIGGQLLGDGGLALNAPVEPMLDALEQSGGTILIADLFARDGERPRGLEAALERKNALMFGNQTWCRLDLYRRLWQQNGVAGPIILYLSYRPTRDEAGAEASFDFSRASAEDRWREGSLDADAAIRRLPAVHASGEVLTAIRRV